MTVTATTRVARTPLNSNQITAIAFIIGVLVLPAAKETKGEPWPNRS